MGTTTGNSVTEKMRPDKPAKQQPHNSQYKCTNLVQGNPWCPELQNS
jgi:hypothetical protein